MRGNIFGKLMYPIVILLALVGKGFRYIAKDELIGSGAIFMVSAVFVAALNYLYHIFMGRLLGPSEYGVLGSLFAIVYLTTLSSNTLNRVVSKYAAEFEGRKFKLIPLFHPAAIIYNRKLISLWEEDMEIVKKEIAQKDLSIV